MKHESRLGKRESGEETARTAANSANQGALEFQTPEEALRTDRDATEVPARVAERLEASIAREPAPRRPWWRRIFGR
jgi:hypothetical protein